VFTAIKPVIAKEISNIHWLQ